MAVNSKVDICNLALGTLGNYGSVNDIESPVSDLDRKFARWYDICRESCLKIAIPNFAMKRRNLAKLVKTPPFGFTNIYAYPSDVLKVLGIGNIKDRKIDSTIEDNEIYTNEDYPDGLPIRYISNEKDVASFSSEFKLLLAEYLAAYTCSEITQDTARAEALKNALPAKIGSASAQNAQENMPIRISRSRFKMARFVYNPQLTDKE